MYTFDYKLFKRHPKILLMHLDSIQKKLRLKLIEDRPINEALALISCYEANALAKKDLLHLNFSRFYKAKYLGIKGEINKSNLLLKRIIPFFEQNKQDFFLHACLNCLGKNKLKQGNIEEGLLHLETALAFDDTLAENLADSNLQIIQFLILFGDYDKALNKCKRALKQLDVSNIFELGPYLQILLESVEILLQQKRPKKAKEILHKVELLLLKLKVAEVTAVFYEKYAKYCAQLKDHKQAAIFYQKAIQHSDSNQLHCHSFNNRIFLAESFLAQKKINAAEKLLMEAFNNYRQQEKRSFLNLLDKLVIVYLMKGNKIAQNRFEEELQLHSM